MAGERYKRKEATTAKETVDIIKHAEEPEVVHVLEDDGSRWQMPTQRFDELYEVVKTPGPK